MARQHAEILERRQQEDGNYLLCRIFIDGDPDDAGLPTTIELGTVEIHDGAPANVKSALTDEAKRLMQLPVGKVIDF